jgi:ribosomal protein S18 acetylase RimI-like enzyme
VPGLRLRAAVPADAPALADLVVDALWDKYRPALGSRARVGVTAIIEEALGAGPGGAGHQVVAEVEGRIAGTVHLLIGPGAGQAPGFARLAREAGRCAAARAVLVFGLLAPPPLAADSASIDELAVAPWARRRGVGRALVEECARLTLSAGRERLTLMVTCDNEAARSLYRAAGFAEVARRRWIVRRWVFGAPGALILERRLPPR